MESDRNTGGYRVVDFSISNQPFVNTVDFPLSGHTKPGERGDSIDPNCESEIVKVGLRETFYLKVYVEEGQVKKGRLEVIGSD